jgi:hypothetical protein
MREIIDEFRDEEAVTARDFVSGITDKLALLITERVL